MGVPHLYRQKFTVLLLDILAFFAAFVLAMHLRFNADIGIFEPGYPPWEPMLNAAPVMMGVWLVTLWSSSMYRLERLRFLGEVGGLLRSLTIFLGILLSITFFYRGFSYSRGFTLLFVPLLIGVTFVCRTTFRVVRRRLMALDGVRHPVLLVGLSPVAEHLAKTSREPDSPIQVVGVLDNDATIGTELVPGIEVLGRTDALDEIAKRDGAEGIMITSSKLDEAAQLELLDACLASKLEWQVVPNVYELMLDRVSFDVVAGVPVLGLRRSNIRGLNRVLKRAFDLWVSSFLVICVSPLLLAVAALIKLTSRGPILYKQERVGQNGELFEFLKFRSMHVNNDDSIHREYAKKWIEEGEAASENKGGAVFKIEKDPRLIPIGAFIRKFSIDELPQLINVVKGDMSLIGPRPAIAYEVEVYREWHRRRLEGPQGITGLWQVSGRNRLSFDEMVKLDIEYIENWSFGLDMRILWRTVGVVLFGRAY